MALGYDQPLYILGADIARKAEGVRLAMPVEKSGQDEFHFDCGEDFPAHIEEFDPDFSKVLVRYNPEGDPGMNERQTARLERLSDWLHTNCERISEQARSGGRDGVGLVVLGRGADDAKVHHRLRQGAGVYESAAAARP